MLSLGLHCRLIGRPGRAAALRRAIEHFQSHPDVWFATRLEIAEHWAQQNPPLSVERPSEMERERFVSEFGGIFEHSPWIAEGAFDLEKGATYDGAIGVHSLLARVFRSASDEQRLGVLRAHPDLAGKLAAANRLTADSTAEQASVGLDALTDDERSQLTQMNTDYTAKFGFPFIIAVRDNTKASIIEAFERRIGNDRETEFSEACRQVERIAELRLIEKFGA
jgi:OHCU decarboxylase